MSRARTRPETSNPGTSNDDMAPPWNTGEIVPQTRTSAGQAQPSGWLYPPTIPHNILCGFVHAQIEIRRVVDRANVKNAKRVLLMEANLDHQLRPNHNEELAGLVYVVQHLVG